MKILNLLTQLAKTLPVLLAAHVSGGVVLLVCFVWLAGKLMNCICDVLIVRAQCARDIRVASIHSSSPNARPPNEQATRLDRHKKNRHG
ncbi:hypothetical protein BAU15_03875 [Enterococcus sp. JM4C]|uniref:hypothetical protein n=1 Tax=Candidatus Enterococcus huntleyi TaxID=1857217 RepID=UPI001379E070|nr:hypothetical protein [Enterococcus sp. JM4C]KAF1295688.1 hypothetical protein BAU15_03875 [Enterococcus sp. JM4C]